MSSITIIGAGNMGSAIAGLALAAGSQVQVLTREATEVDPRVTAGTVGDEITGDVVVLALPYGALDDVLGAYEGRLDGKVLVDITNPLDFATFDSLVVPADGSAAAEIAKQLPGAKVIKALVPLSEMFGYVGDLRSKTSGRASYSMQFDSYAEVPKAVAEEIVKKARGE